MFRTVEFFVVVGVLTFVWRVASAHWYCDNLNCPQDYAILVHESTEIDIYEKGNCFLGEVTRHLPIVGLRCAAACAQQGCFAVVKGSDGCLVLGVGTLPLHSPSTLYRSSASTSSFYEVAQGKPVTASSANPPVGGNVKWEPENANDGITSNKYHFFHSMDSASEDPNPHLQIDLLKSYAVYKISFLPRIENSEFWIGAGRGENLTVYVGSAEVTNGSYAGVYDQLLFMRSQNETSLEQLGWSHLTAPIPRCGRYVVVKKEQRARDDQLVPLEITEIQVFTKNP